MKFKIEKVTVELEDQEFLDVVDTAGYGIVYWAVAPCVVDDEAITYTVRYCIDDDGEPAEPGDTVRQSYRRLTKSDLERAWADMITKRPTIYTGQFLTGDAGEIDASAADCLIQWALWGKVVFG